VRDVSPESPEERRKHPEAHPHQPGFWGRIGPGSWAFETGRRILVGVYNEGFVHAGNLAYLTLLSVFPFFIIVAAIAQIYGGEASTASAIHAVARTLPASVAGLIETTAQQVLAGRSGGLLWLGAAVGLWTVGSYIETIREILRRAYGTDYGRPFWHYRLLGIGMIVFAVALLLTAFSAQLLLTTIEEVVVRFVPRFGWVADTIAETRFIPLLAIFFGSYLLFWTLAPGRYRKWRYVRWPGALLTTLWWWASVALLPRTLELFGGYALTYGGLAGVMVALLFFYLVGYGLVIGAHVNAALVDSEGRH
jgi:membrane protein